MSTSTGTAVSAEIRRDVLVASGPEAEQFLQGQLSQDVAGLAVGASAWSFVLQPQGKVDAWLRVHRVDAETFALDVDAGFGSAVQARIERFKLRTKCEFDLSLAVPTVAVRGASAPGGLPCGWPGLVGTDQVGSTVVPPEVAGSAHAIGVDAYEALRIRHGVPAMGSELTEATIPAEVGQWVIDASVSFTKGCYTGQELVARIDSRGGNVPRRLRRIAATTGDLTVGGELVVAGDVVGTLTSVARDDAGSVGLAFVRRGVADGDVDGTVDGVPVTISAG